MTKRINVAVVGVGYLGRIHAKIYHEMESANLVAVVDSDRASADTVANQYDCTAMDSIDQLMSSEIDGGLDAVSIVVPTSLHLPISRPFLEKGIHMLLEKPIAPGAKESAEIVSLAKANNAILQIGHLERFNAGVMKLAEMADNPRFIEVHRLGKFVERATDVDVVTDLMIHDIDIVLSLVPSRLKQVSATGTSVVTNHVDIANARLEFENGAVANVTASRVSRNQFRRIRVFSPERYLGLNFADQQLEQVITGDRPDGSDFPELIESKVNVEPQLPLNAELAHFVDCVSDGRKPLVTGDDGLVAVEVAELVKEKIRHSMAFTS
ncbi:MAG: Gfo/Idh/MocA family oxidoreductase [Acidiferrobacterales bacterium]|nr:Gfo/Idh/MocA family oxidoreductase [Acidiferrobacterales bacterium]